MIHRSCVAVALLLLLNAPALAQQQWGDLTMRFVYDGEPPKPGMIKISADREIADESLIVNDKSLGVANVCVWLSTEDSVIPPVHPAVAAAGNNRFTGTIREGRVTPHILVVQPPQSCVVRNDDPVGYNTLVDFLLNGEVNPVLEAGGTYAKLLELEESQPARLACAIHASINAYVIVRSTPYVAVSDESGTISFKNLPAGKWTFVVWHERTGFVKQATRAGIAVKWHRGRTMLEVKRGENKLGEFKLSPGLFHK